MLKNWISFKTNNKSDDRIIWIPKLCVWDQSLIYRQRDPIHHNMWVNQWSALIYSQTTVWFKQNVIFCLRIGCFLFYRKAKQNFSLITGFWFIWWFKWRTIPAVIVCLHGLWKNISLYLELILFTKKLLFFETPGKSLSHVLKQMPFFEVYEKLFLIFLSFVVIDLITKWFLLNSFQIYLKFESEFKSMDESKHKIFLYLKFEIFWYKIQNKCVFHCFKSEPNLLPK